MTDAATRLANAVRIAAGVLLVVVTTAKGAVILRRYVGFVTAWADEVARIAFIWSVCLGAASGTHRGLNFAIPLLATKREGRARQLLESLIALIVIALCALLAWATTQWIPVAGLARLPALGVSGAWFHWAVTVFALLTASFMLVRLASLWRPGADLRAVPAIFVHGIDSFILLSIPLFVLVGVIMNAGGISQRLLDLAVVLVGHFRAGIAHVNIVASMIFSGMSGTTTSDVAGLGRIEIPMMIKEGFRPETAAVVTAVSATIGPIIPPSVPFVLYGALTSTSVGKRFMGGVIPGRLPGFWLMAVIAWLAHRGHISSARYTRGRASFGNILTAVRRSAFTLMTPVILIGGIVTGWFAPTEAAGVAAASVFGWLVIQAGAADIFLNLIRSAKPGPMMTLVILNAIMLIMGMFIEATSMIILLSPILVPLIRQTGVDPVHFGVVFVLNMMIATITPPVGICGLIASDIAGVSMQRFTVEVIPCVIAMIAFLLLILFVPPLS